MFFFMFVHVCFFVQYLGNHITLHIQALFCDLVLEHNDCALLYLRSHCIAVTCSKCTLWQCIVMLLIFHGIPSHLKNAPVQQHSAAHHNTGYAMQWKTLNSIDITCFKLPIQNNYTLSCIAAQRYYGVMGPYFQCTSVGHFWTSWKQPLEGELGVLYMQYNNGNVAPQACKIEL